MTFDASYQGLVMRGSGALYRYTGSSFSGTGAAVDNNAVYRTVALTGYKEISKAGNVGYQTTDGHYIILSEGWETVGQTSIAKYSQSQAQAQVNRIIKNNQVILCNNLICARYANLLTEEQRVYVRTLQSRLQTRNDALQSEGLTANVQTSYPAGYAELAPYMDVLMKGESVGVATWVVVVIAATVLAATATAAYFTYKRLADESESDVKFSKDLTRTLTSKLTEAEYQQLLNETKGIVTKSKIKLMLSNYWSMIKYVAFGVAIVAGYRLVKNKMQEQ